jgi:hypothetical protein
MRTREIQRILRDATPTLRDIAQAALLARHGRTLRDEASQVLKREYDQHLRELRLGR